MPSVLIDSDQKLIGDLTDQLAHCFRSLLPELHVCAEGGILTISGSVTCPSDHYAILAAARSVPGVQAVVDHLDLEPALLETDGILAKNAVDALTRQGYSPEGRILITVRGGMVILDGAVSWHCQRMAAGACVRSLPGVLGVCNRLELQAKSL